jgi:two-component system cell cycle response regulator
MCIISADKKHKGPLQRPRKCEAERREFTPSGAPVSGVLAMKILVADDDVIMRTIMAETLRHSGYEVVTAENGRQAVHELSAEDGPRLALIDWMMPEQDGPSVCREVRSRHDDSYVYMLLLTSKQSRQDVVMGLEAGADDYLKKPCDREELKARLRTGRRILQLEDTLVRAREEMRFKATHDALTSLWDRGAILALLQSELNRAARERSPVSLLLCDIDHFKQVNDTFGHSAGDDILREVALRLSNSVRSHDAVGRYGGEEFLIVLGGCTADDLPERADHIRNAIQYLAFTTHGRSIPISLSAGATTIADCIHPPSIETLLKRVDAALYRAKSSGRNRVCYA